MPKLTRPYSIQIELAEGCSRLCNFCGLNGIRTKPGNYKFMTIESAFIIANNVKELYPEIRMEFAMHGEPTMNPKYLEIISIFRHALPDAQMQLTTNGVRVLKKPMAPWADAIFKAGINFILLDTYYPERDSLREKAFAYNKAQGKIKVVDYYDDMLPAKLSPWSKNKALYNTIILMDDLEARNKESRARVIYNHAGNSGTAPALHEPLKKSCTLPFRELGVRWDGGIALCCHDWKGKFMIANATKTSLKEIWINKRLEAARAMLQNKNRSMSPCNVCDIGSGVRSGLLPKYGAITQKEIDLIGDNFDATAYELNEASKVDLFTMLNPKK